MYNQNFETIKTEMIHVLYAYHEMCFPGSKMSHLNLLHEKYSNFNVNFYLDYRLGECIYDSTYLKRF